jgi:hypothetical protein
MRSTTWRQARQLRRLERELADGESWSRFDRGIEASAFFGAFARRFYADRAELESLGIQLGVEKPGEGFFEASSTRCRRELLPRRDRVHATTSWPR